MTQEKLPAAFQGRVSKSTAERILQTAADLDAVGDEMVELQELRIAARDAGISVRSFDMSVAELRRRSFAPPQQPPKIGKALSYMALAGAGTLGGATVLALVSLAVGPAPQEAIIGALLGGAGSIAAVMAYLRVALRGGSSATESADTRGPGTGALEAFDHLAAGPR